MSINALVDRLAGDLRPIRRHRLAIDAGFIGLLCALELGLVLGMGMMRPDLPTALAAPSVWWKLVSLALIAMVGGAAALRSFDPVRSPRRGLRGVTALAGLCLLCGWGLDASGAGWPALVTRLDWPDGLDCVRSIVVLSLPPLIGLGILMRRGAPTDTGGSALAAGIAAAAWGAFVFVFSCPFDDPLYVAVWYVVGCGLVVLLARLVLPPLTRW